MVEGAARQRPREHGAVGVAMAQSRRLEVGGWRLEVGGWRLEVGEGRMEVGGVVEGAARQRPREHGAVCVAMAQSLGAGACAGTPP